MSMRISSFLVFCVLVLGVSGLEAQVRRWTMPDGKVLVGEIRSATVDTVVLIGSVSAQYPDRVAFAGGAITASFVFFFGLGYGARLLAPLFARPRAWQWFDAAIGVTMWAIAVKLLFF